VENVRAYLQSNASLERPKFVAKIADFKEAYRDTLTKNIQFAAEFWMVGEASQGFDS